MQETQETQETWVQSLGWEDTLKEEIATHSSVLAWKISLTKETEGLQSVESQRVGYDGAGLHTHSAPSFPCALESVSFPKVWSLFF